jgi:hypothetical protein
MSATPDSPLAKPHDGSCSSDCPRPLAAAHFFWTRHLPVSGLSLCLRGYPRRGAEREHSSLVTVDLGLNGSVDERVDRGPFEGRELFEGRMAILRHFK